MCYLQKERGIDLGASNLNPGATDVSDHTIGNKTGQPVSPYRLPYVLIMACEYELPTCMDRKVAKYSIHQIHSACRFADSEERGWLIQLSV